MVILVPTREDPTVWVKEVPEVSMLLQTPHIFSHGLSALGLWNEALSSAELSYSESHCTLGPENNWDDTAQGMLGNSDRSH